jgi:hypothetical protein
MAKTKHLFLIILFAGLLSGSAKLYAQSRFPGMYLISFTDKNNSPYSVNKPEQFLSGRAILRRQAASVAISVQDFPPNPFYIDSITKYDARPLFSSRWLNAVLVRMDDSLKLEQIKLLAFVDSTAYLAPVKPAAKKKKSKKRTKAVNTGVQEQATALDYGASRTQLELIGITDLHRQGFLGEEVQIAVLDNGFIGMKKMSVFNDFFDNGQLLGTKDFANPGGDVFKEGSHGTYVMSMMAAFEEGVLCGSAPGASYWLLVTEDGSYEYPIEEFNWLAGAEFADSAGADVITSSLIYSTFDDTTLSHTHAQLDGKTAIVSRAAQIAAEKGILVFNSAGNDARNDWHKIGFPADAKDIITVGAVNMDGVYAGFSSTGYTADGRVKPDVAAVGEKAKSVSISTGKIIEINGTSFSNPTVAGAAAVLLQANKDKSLPDIRNAIRQSASHADYPDSLTGYGIPDFYMAHLLLNNKQIDAIKQEDGFTLFPNPAHDDVYVLLYLNDSQLVDISIVDVGGKTVWEQSQVQFSKGLNRYRLKNLNALTQGVYIVVLQFGDKTRTEKLIR